MGTNFYWHKEGERCPTCGRHDDEELHIGKSSVGWEFSFRGYPELGLTSWAAWKNKLQEDGGKIVSEYGNALSLEEFRKKVEDRQHPSGLRNSVHTDPTGWKDAFGYGFHEREFS